LDFDAVNKSSRTDCKIRTKLESTVTGCFIGLSGINKWGYSTIQPAVENPQSGQEKYKTVYLHRLAWTARNNQNPPTNAQVSHLCNNPPCFNADHLTIESGEENRDRRFCKGQIKCPHHFFKVVMDMCTHSPKCISPPPAREDFHCCALENSDQPTSDASLPTEEFAASQLAVEQIRSQDFSDMPPVDESPLTDDDLVLPEIEQQRVVPNTTDPDSESSIALPIAHPQQPTPQQQVVIPNTTDPDPEFLLSSSPVAQAHFPSEPPIAMEDDDSSMDDSTSEMEYEPTSEDLPETDPA
jgi:hypothetical protein